MEKRHVTLSFRQAVRSVAQSWWRVNIAPALRFRGLLNGQKMSNYALLRDDLCFEARE